MKSKKIMAVTLAATMVVGSSMTVFAEDPAPTGVNGATGEGTTFEHVDKDIIAVTLPTQAAVTDVFDYCVDPEGLIKDAGTLTDGTTEVTGNTDGVYFKNKVTSSGTEAVDASATAYSIGGSTSPVTSGLKVTVPTSTTASKLIYKDSTLDSADNVSTSGWYEEVADSDYSGKSPVAVNIVDDGNGSVPTPESGDTITVKPYEAATSGSTTTSYSSSSDAVKFEGKNSVDVDVSVEAAVTASEGGKDIALVADATALAAAKTPALLMKLKVGSDEKIITSAGATAKAKIEGVADNFAVKAEGGKYVYKIRTNVDDDPLDDWNATTVQLIGKTNTADVPEGTGALTAPEIALTWSVAKHTEAAQEPEEPESYVSATTVSISAKALTLDLPENVTISKVELVLNGNTTTLVRGNHYTVSDTTLTIGKYAAGWAGGSIKVTYSDDHVDTLTCQ